MSKRFDIISEFKGYRTKPDPTNTDPRYLTSGSYNVLINDTEKLVGRKGYSLLGQSSSTTKPIESEFVWNTSSGTEIALRGLDNKIQVLVGETWIDLITSLPTAKVGFPRSSQSGIWVDSTGQDYLPFVAKDSNVYTWSGCIATVASVTLNSITKSGSETWAEARVNTSGTKIVLIDGVEYTYTGGETTTTLTGVTPDPSSGGVTAGDIAIQKVTTNSNKPGSGLTNDIIEILNNQIIVGDHSSREIYISSNSTLLDFTTISTPRVPGQAAVLTLDNVPTSFVVQEDTLYISAGKSDWYFIQFEIQTSSTAFIETVTVKKLKNAPQQGAKERDLVANIKNSVIFISHEPTLDELGRVENVNTPQSKPISDPIKPDFDALDFTGGDIRYFKNQIFIAVPLHATVLIFDLNNGWWQPPQTMAISKFSVYDGKLIGHSSLVSESYILFEDDQLSDNGGVINMQAVFAYRNFDDREMLKSFTKYFTEGYLSSNTEITLTLQFDFGGGSGEKEFTISGSDETILTASIQNGGLGSLPLGSGPIGGVSIEGTDLKKFRQINGMRDLDFYEVRAIYSTTSEAAQFEILSHGPQVKISPNLNNHITK